MIDVLRPLRDGPGPYFLHLDQTDEAVELVKKHHYSHRAPSNIQVVATAHEDGGLFGDLGRVVAACFVSIPGSGHYKIDGEPVPTLELTRLVRRPDLAVNLSGLIAWSLRWVWKLRKGDLVVSYADKAEGHHGGIYQAASWCYDGFRDPIAEGVILDGEHFIPNRTAVSRKEVQKKYKGYDVTVKKTEGKYCYWKALSRAGVEKAKRIGLESHPYPRPRDVPEQQESHTPSVFCRREDRHPRSECGYFGKRDP